MANEEKIKISIECLMHAISDTQDTIRYYDIKSEIIGALLSAFVGITNLAIMNDAFLSVKCFLFLSLFFDFSAILSIGFVLYPRAAMFKNINYGSYAPKNTYFMVNYKKTISEQVDLVNDTEWVSELTFELSKLSLIRDRKYYFFKLVLLLSGASLFLISFATFLIFIKNN
jgi:hypothetical protein